MPNYGTDLIRIADGAVADLVANTNQPLPYAAITTAISVATTWLSGPEAMASYPSGAFRGSPNDPLGGAMAAPSAFAQQLSAWINTPGLAGDPSGMDDVGRRAVMSSLMWNYFAGWLPGANISLGGMNKSLARALIGVVLACGPEWQAGQ
jgi:hypothetical protein